jgi:hypothetical protein
MQILGGRPVCFALAVAVNVLLWEFRPFNQVPGELDAGGRAVKKSLAVDRSVNECVLRK